MAPCFSQMLVSLTPGTATVSYDDGNVFALQEIGYDGEVAGDFLVDAQDLRDAVKRGRGNAEITHTKGLLTIGDSIISYSHGQAWKEPDGLALVATGDGRRVHSILSLAAATTATKVDHELQDYLKLVKITAKGNLEITSTTRYVATYASLTPPAPIYEPDRYVPGAAIARLARAVPSTVDSFEVSLSDVALEIMGGSGFRAGAYYFPEGVHSAPNITKIFASYLFDFDVTMGRRQLIDAVRASKDRTLVGVHMGPNGAKVYGKECVDTVRIDYPITDQTLVFFNPKMLVPLLEGIPGEVVIVSFQRQKLVNGVKHPARIIGAGLGAQPGVETAIMTAGDQPPIAD